MASRTKPASKRPSSIGTKSKARLFAPSPKQPPSRGGKHEYQVINKKFRVNTAVSSGRIISPESDPASGLLSEIEASGPDVAALCSLFGLKRDELVRLTGFSSRALADWAAGKLPSQPAQRRLHEVRRLLEALAEVVKISSIPPWLNRSNMAFQGMTPLQVIEVGEIDRLWAMVHQMGAGEPE